MRGTVGISGGREVEEGYGWRVFLVLLYYFLKVVDWVLLGVDSGYNHKTGTRYKDG